MKEFCVCGHFGFGKELFNGQTIKTQIITAELIRRYGDEKIIMIDTHGGISTYFKLPFQLFNGLRKSKNLIIFPAHNGVKIMAPILVLENLLFQRKLHYVVIGGWLPKLVREKLFLARQLKKFTKIYVETKTMKGMLEEQGFNNIVIMPNCKPLRILREEELIYQKQIPYKLCTFSRVMKEKGIEDAINAIKKVNEENEKMIYTLDIYGQVENDQKEWFDKLQKEFPAYIKYQGVVPYDRSVEVLKNYYILLFPTHFYTEGIPGTIIDAYAAGIPVVCSKWESFEDIVDNDETGIGYDFTDKNGLTNVLSELAIDSDRVQSLKKACLRKATDYLPKKVLNCLCDEI